MSPSGRRYLVIVRAGEKSLHRGWLEGGPRNWDLVVSWYGAETYQTIADERVLPAKGWKWDVLAAQLDAEPELVAGYEYFWFPDDDIEADAGRISRMFELTETQGLAISQPALSADSYFSHLHTMQARSFLLRYVDFVEVMVPCLSRQTLLRALPLMHETPSGFGLDFLWTRFERDNGRRAAVLDAVPVRHTRPVGKFLAKRIAAEGSSSKEIGRRLLARFGVKWQHRQLHTYAGLDRNGRYRNRRSTVIHMLIDYALSFPRGVEPMRWRRLRKALGHIKAPPRLKQVVERVSG